MTDKEQQEHSEFNFNISLSVLNHLGRNLYRSFITVIGEAISNSWDADAENVWITINKDENYFVIKDDGIGMSKSDFQDKFLKIGYTKRKDGVSKSPKGRPFIGRKGIGKLALLSCATKISIITKTSATDYVGGVIDNNQLDKDIDDDINAQDSKLGVVDNEIFSNYKTDRDKGTIIYFEDIHEGIRNRLDYIEALVALYFRFSLVDSNFNIYINDNKITVEKLKGLADKTQFLWKINKLKDPYIKLIENLKEQQEINSKLSVTGFIASVEKPANLKIKTSDEKIGVDLFVNGRLREKNILSHFSTFSTRVVASYLYGQIHFNQLDLKEAEDKFTSAREGVKEGDEDFKALLDEIDKWLKNILDEWDEWRIKHRQDGDIENSRKTPKERAVKSLVNVTIDEYTQTDSPNKSQIDEWTKSLTGDAEFNTSAYIDCFLSENLLRKYIHNRNIPFTGENTKISKEIDKYKQGEINSKRGANISFDLRENNDDLSYLGMDFLAKIADSHDKQEELVRESKTFKPIRNVVGHTGLLTKSAKGILNSTYKNIKKKIDILLNKN